MRRVAWEEFDWWVDLDPGLGGGDSYPPPPGEPPDALPPPEPWRPPEPEGGPTAPPGSGDEGPAPVRPPETETVRIEEWRTAGDDRVCPICGPLDGTRWEEDDGPVPPAHEGCRCVRVAVATEERTARRAPLPGPRREDGAWRRW